MLYITTNKHTLPIRNEVLNDVTHLVVPVVALVEGVLNNILVTSESIIKSLPGWNGRPITLDHPINGDGEFTTANSPEQMQTSTIGALYNVAVKNNNKLVGEMWINLEIVNKIGGDAIEAVKRFERGELVEVSTGYNAEVIPQSGMFNNVTYGSIFVNILPDHLAILLHTQGACNIDDGCGAPRVNKRIESMTRRTLRGLTTNSHFSFEDIARNLQQTIQQATTEFIWVTHVFDDFVVYEAEVGNDFILFKRDYTMNESGEIELSDPREVIKQTNFVEVPNSTSPEAAAVSTNVNFSDVSGDTTTQANIINWLKNAITGNSDGNNLTQENILMNEQVQSLAANCGCPFDLEELQAMPDSAIVKLTTQYTQPEETPPVTNTVTDPPPEDTKSDEVVPAWAQGLVANIEQLTEQVTNLTEESNKREADSKTAVIGRLVANNKCPFDADELADFSLEQLNKMVGSYTPTNYVGNVGALASNVATDEQEAITMNGISAGGNDNG